jgi:hypothetical protein
VAEWKTGLTDITKLRLIFGISETSTTTKYTKFIIYVGLSMCESMCVCVCESVSECICVWSFFISKGVHVILNFSLIMFKDAYNIFISDLEFNFHLLGL